MSPRGGAFAGGGNLPAGHALFFQARTRRDTARNRGYTALRSGNQGDCYKVRMPPNAGPAP